MPDSRLDASLTRYRINPYEPFPLASCRTGSTPLFYVNDLRLAQIQGGLRAGCLYPVDHYP